ncbi:glycerophosphodiester phosphodiesterase family protein [Desertivirga arenae]|uniref:glycerophosphodiester phosphodiesterase family protein n=1 Tax=Desertivirga arenae TaxID=2810309 RepID=UPI001A967AA9|nr:glycerophosphodiester phosphodiesterase family protein [Pedobacter sp. SYSU D00823]
MFKIIFPALLAGLIVVGFKSVETLDVKVEWPGFSREAHRGGRGLAPENTIPAMIDALDRNITTLEMDCQITADGEVIVSHDSKINTQFSLSGSGKEIGKEEAEKLILFQMSYEEIRKFDVGSKAYLKFPRQKKINTYIPKLGDLIDSVQENIRINKRKQVFYNIETKISPEGDNKLHPEPEKFVELLMNVINQKRISPWVIIQSFDPRTLEIIHRNYPEVKTSFLVAAGDFNTNLKKLSFKPDVYSPMFSLVNKELIAEVHEKNIKIIPWTVNEGEKIDELKKMGTDGIISDYPDLF